jgi:hypothetical protein
VQVVTTVGLYNAVSDESEKQLRTVRFQNAGTLDACVKAQYVHRLAELKDAERLQILSRREASAGDRLHVHPASCVPREIDRFRIIVPSELFLGRACCETLGAFLL